MTQNPSSALVRLPVWTAVALALLAGGLTLWCLTGAAPAFCAALWTAIIEGAAAAAVVIAAGGYGYMLLRLVAPKSAPTGLRTVTACVLGLWLFSTAVLVVGSASHGLLKPWLWWPVVAVGILLAAWQCRKKLLAWQPVRRADGWALMWVVVAAAAGTWLAGATHPPGAVGLQTNDAYDVLEYHLQAPREFFDAQHVGQLQHNCYSHYPLGVEMLFLLAMALRGGAYEGMYLAKLLHGAFAVLAVAGVWTTLKRDEQVRGRFAAMLLATAPLLLYLSWLAMVELAEVCCLAVALLWLRQWLRGGGLRAATCIGLCLGAACAVKYLAVGFVAGPVVAVMVIVSLLKRRRLASLRQVLMATGVTALLFSPWLIRNIAYTGNPVFPLATSVFGRGHFSAQSQQRWADGHGPDKKPPVPTPAGWKMSPASSRFEMFYDNFLTSDWFGPLMMAVAGVAVCAMIVSAGKTETWDWAILGVLGLQLAVWTALTHEMPARFIAPAMVPIALLAGGGLAKLARRRRGLLPAAAVLLAAVVVNMLITFNIYSQNTSGPLNGVSGEQIARNAPIWKDAHQLPQGAKILLVGDAKAFYFPPGTLYATAFDTHPLAAIIDRGKTPGEIIDELRAMGVTHLWFDWPEIRRLATTYGYPSALSADLLLRLTGGEPPGLDILDAMSACGLTISKHITPSNKDKPILTTIYALPAAATKVETTQPN
ncbi:MAG: glycosyltransferase family 39 protein [Planctomycetota bacterium]|nr:glycosyltransferase family 39 protein [Planctomycetota bacterium]